MGEPRRVGIARRIEHPVGDGQVFRHDHVGRAERLGADDVAFEGREVLGAHAHDEFGRRRRFGGNGGRAGERECEKNRE